MPQTLSQNNLWRCSVEVMTHSEVLVRFLSQIVKKHSTVQYKSIFHNFCCMICKYVCIFSGNAQLYGYFWTTFWNIGRFIPKNAKNGQFLWTICYNRGSIILSNILRKALTGQERIQNRPTQNSLTQLLQTNNILVIEFTWLSVFRLKHPILKKYKKRTVFFNFARNV